MKSKLRKSFLFIPVLIMALFMLEPLSAQANEGLDIKAESAILVDAETGKVLYSKEPDMPLPPASMTKMMTEYLVWEAIESGEISWETTTQISDYPYSISADNSFSGVGLYQDVDYTVRSLYEAMAINSDNATSIALAELISGSEGEFVKLMNEKGEEMGLTDYKFVNTTGLENTSLGDNYPDGTEPDDTNLLSARSSALLAYHLVNDYPESLDISSVPEIEFDNKTIRNWNWMLEHDASFLKEFHYKGVDGLKTGHTDLAGYSFTGTAEQNNQRVISVVMKTGSVEERFKETTKLFDYGFSKFERTELFPANYQIKDKSSIMVAKGKKKVVGFATEDALSSMIKKDEEEKYLLEYHLDEKMLNKEGELTAPIKKGEKIGTAKLIHEDEQESEYIFSKSGSETVDIITTEGVEKSNWFMLTLGAIGSFFGSLFSTVVDTVKSWF